MARAPIQSPSVLLPSHSTIRHFHLNSRGRVFQERLLAPRTVHFDHHQVYWECHVHSASSSFPLGAKHITKFFTLRDKVFNPFKQPPYSWSGKPDELFIYQWAKLVKDYSKGEFTKPEDRLVAIGFVGQIMCQYYSDEYIAGFPTSILPLALNWTRQGYESKRDHIQFKMHDYKNFTGIPSWSWCSIPFLSR
jgi:hypothetical protein